MNIKDLDWRKDCCLISEEAWAHHVGIAIYSTFATYSYCANESVVPLVSLPADLLNAMEPLDVEQATATKQIKRIFFPGIRRGLGALRQDLS